MDLDDMIAVVKKDLHQQPYTVDEVNIPLVPLYRLMRNIVDCLFRFANVSVSVWSIWEKYHFPVSKSIRKRSSSDNEVYMYFKVRNKAKTYNQVALPIHMSSLAC